MRAIQFSPAAFRELEDWGRLDWRRQQKILELIQQVAREPFSGVKGSVLDIVYSPPSFLRRYKRWFR